VRTEAALVLHEHTGVVAAFDQVIDAAAVQAVIAPVHAGAEQVAGGDGDVGLHRCAVAMRLGAADGTERTTIVRFVVAATDAGRHRQAFGRGIAHLSTQYLLQRFGVVVVAVVVVLAFGTQRAAFHAPLFVEGVSTARALGQVAVPIAVGFVGAAAGEGRRRAAAGVDAIAVLVGD